jgi:plastocyanin
LTLRVPLLICACAALGLTACGSSSSSSSSSTATTPASTAPSTAAPSTTGSATTPTSVNPPAGGSKLSLQADPSGMLAFIPTSLTAKAGKVTIDFANASPIQHDVVVAKGTTVIGSTPVFNGGAKSLTVTLAKGTYAYYCSVPGHRQAGMQGTLTVN